MKEENRRSLAVHFAHFVHNIYVLCLAFFHYLFIFFVIQSKNMRSVSEHHFLPRWLDPHYKDVYVHPDYKQQASASTHTPDTVSAHLADSVAVKM